MAASIEAELERACTLLELATPDAMNESALALEHAARELAAQRESITRDEAVRVQTIARRARLLMDLAARFHARWYAMLGAMTGGYTAQGSPAEFSARPRLSISG
jgi:hypothetical protein